MFPFVAERIILCEYNKKVLKLKTYVPLLKHSNINKLAYHICNLLGIQQIFFFNCESATTSLKTKKHLTRYNLLKQRR